MSGRRVWFARDAWLTADPKVEVLADEFGAEGVLAFEEVCALAKIENAAGRVDVRYSVLARRAHIRRKRDVPAIVAKCVDLGLVELEESNERGAILRIAQYKRWQVTDVTAAERMRRYRGRLREAGVEVNVPPKVYAEVMERDNATCQRCGSIEEPTVDHIVPKSKGGRPTLDNLQVLCWPCNRAKGVTNGVTPDVTEGER